MSFFGSKARGSWSLRWRITWWVACFVMGLLVVETSLAHWFVRDALRRELDALSVEEAAEFRVGLTDELFEPKTLEALADKLDREHPEARLSVRVWRAAEPEPWITAGAKPKRPWPRLSEHGDDETVAPDRLLRWRAISLDARTRAPDGTERDERIRAEILIDGSPRHADLEKAATILLLIALIGGGGAMLAGFLFAKSLARLLARVAESAAVAWAAEDMETVAPVGAPAEIRKVVDAFQGSLQELEAGHSRNVLLTAGLAHELGSPLQNLITEAEVGLLSDRDGPEYRRLLGSQLEELRALALVVDNLITLTALRDHRTLARHESFDLANEARVRLSLEEHEAARRDITLDVQTHGDCRHDGDREALVLMLRNLVGNAIRWTAPRSTVTVTLDGRGAPFLITVADEGPGVPPEEREAIFNAFYQGETPSGTRSGYGLGLALARAAARSEGGDIHVENTEAGGASFVVSLPRTQSEASTVGAREARPTES